MSKIDCINCKYYDYNISEECDWCNFNKEVTGACGWCNREFEDLEEATECYDKKVDECDNLQNINYENAVEIANLNQQIHELKEQLKNAIVPRFNKGSLVCYIYDNKIIIDNCTIDKIKISATIEECWRKVKIQYKLTYNAKYFNEDELFATREEAEQKLKELKESD